MAAAATDLVIYAGVYDDLIGLWDGLVEERLFFDCGASRNPYKHEGKKTIAYEIAEQLDWQAARRRGGAGGGGRDLHRRRARLRGDGAGGLDPGRPRMVAAQATRANAIASAWREKRAADTRSRSVTRWPRASPPAIPGKKGEWVLRHPPAKRAAWRGTPRTTPSWPPRRGWPGSRGSGPGPPARPASPSSSGSSRSGALDPDGTICVIVSETGLKTEAAPPSRQATRLRRRLAATAGRGAARPLPFHVFSADKVGRPVPAHLTHPRGRSTRRAGASDRPGSQ